MRLSLSITLLIALSLAGCMRAAPNDGSADSSSSSAMSISSAETTDVSYTGVIEEAGISIYMEGTHTLVTPTGEVVLLESDVVALSDYLGQTVTVMGEERPTVESDGRIVKVFSVSVMSAQSSSSDASSSMSSSAVSSSASSAAPVVSSVASSKAPVSSAASVASVPPVSSTPSASGDAAQQQKIDAMAKWSTVAAQWTQQYCTTHVGFCVPMHKNSWFNSFGAAASALWHVEVGPSEISLLGEGPISINLLTGSVESVGAFDKAVVTTNGSVVGYRAWTENRHFEIRGPEALHGLIDYMTQHLGPSQSEA